MIKFKKMTKGAKIVSGIGVGGVTAIALLPIINQLVDNPKARADVFMYKNQFYKSRSEAEAARNKFNAMSGLVGIMKGGDILNPNIDFKPLMAEFVSFISKLFVVKVFEMDKETTTNNHFQYDGLTAEQKAELMQKQIAGEIKYGDLKDITSLVKYASAKKDGNNWMYTPVDKMLLSIIGDGSDQAYSSNELEYAKISKSIEALKKQYNQYYKNQIVDKFDGLSYSLVTGVNHHKDDELQPADKAKSEYTNPGDGSGDEYTDQLIQDYKEWGTLKLAFENSKKDLDTYVSDKNISVTMKPIFEKMVADNAVAGWNNKERYSIEEIELRDLLVRVTKETDALTASVVPGGDTTANVIQGWNWAPSGDESDMDYSSWQLDLAKDIQEREQLAALNLGTAPDGAIEGPNTKPTGDGSGRTYDQTAFDAKNNFENTERTINALSDVIHRFVAAGTTAAPKGGQLGDADQHMDARGLGDDVDYTQTIAWHNQLVGLQSAIDNAQKAQQAFQAQLDQTTETLTTDATGTATTTASEGKVISTILSEKSIAGHNYKVNYNGNQVDLAVAEAAIKDIEAEIAEMSKDGIKAAPLLAKTTNTEGKGDQSGTFYSAEQILLRDKINQQADLGAKIALAKAGRMVAAKVGGTPSPTGEHVDQVGLGDKKWYTGEFVKAVADYNTLKSTLDFLQEQLDNVEKNFPGFKDPKTRQSFDQLKANNAKEGVNTPEQYTQDEIDYTKAVKELKKAQEDFKAANDELGKLETKINDDDKVRQLQADVKAGLTPNLYSNNFQATGDGSGRDYSQHDKDYREALRKLKDAFPKGNPWYTGSDKTSEEAYEHLYNDWKTAIAGGTRQENHQPIGDGTDHEFTDDRWATFSTFLKDSINGLDTPNPDAIQKNTMNQLKAALQTISYYIINHGTLKTNNEYPGIHEQPSTAASLAGTGDSSGNTYINLDAANALYRTVFKAPSHSSAEKMDGTKSWYENWQAAASSDSRMQGMAAEATKAGFADPLAYFNDMDTKAKAFIANYNKELKEKQDAFDTADAKIRPEMAIYGAAQKAMTGLKAPGQPLQGMSDDEIKALGALSLSDNQAKLVVGNKADDLRDWGTIDTRIGTAAQQSSAAADAVEKIKQDDPINYARYFTVDHDHIAYGDATNNAKPIGLGNGKSYTQHQIDGRDHIDRIKAEIAKHITDSTGQAKRLTIILSMTSSSSVGPNYGPGSGKTFVGDQSGNDYADWEVKLYSSEVAPLNALRAIMGNVPWAPKDATEGYNAEGKGDQTGKPHQKSATPWTLGDQYFIQTFIPMLTNAINNRDSKAKVLAGLQKERVRLQGSISGTPQQSLDPTKFFLPTFKTPFNKPYTMDQYKAAVEWVKQNKIYWDSQKRYGDDISDKNAKQKAFNDYKSAQSKELQHQKGQMAYAKQFIPYYAPGGTDYTKYYHDYATTAKNLYDQHITALRTWYDNNKDKSIDPSGTIFGTAKIGDVSFETFSEGEKGDKGSLLYWLDKFHRKGAKTDGNVNVAPILPHTPEELKLKDALMLFVKLPANHNKVPDTSEYQTYIFNTLFAMYSKAIDLKMVAKPAGFIKPSGLDEDDITINKRGNHYTKATAYKSITFKDYTKNGGVDITKTMMGFQKWLYAYFTPDTLQKNQGKTGDGSGTKYTESKLFKSNGKEFTSAADIDAYDLGKIAATVANLHDESSAQAALMTDDSLVGDHKNSAGTGDKSGNYYNQDAIDYFNKFPDAEKLRTASENKQKEADKLKAKAPLGGTLHIVPDSMLATVKPAAAWQEHVGDGSGNDYSHELMEAMKIYFRYKDDLAAKKAELVQQQKDHETHKGEEHYMDWNAVMNAKAGIEIGYNHETYWSPAEIAFHDQNVQSAVLDADVAGLLAKDIQVKVHNPDGTVATKTVKAGGWAKAPAGAVEGWNDVPTGIHDGSTYTFAEIKRRDDLKVLNDKLTFFKAEEARLKALLAPENVGAAPMDAEYVDDKDWHPHGTGDLTGKYYDAQIFEDIKKMQALKDATAAAIKAKAALIDRLGTNAVDQINKEIAAGALTGLNNSEKYSADEIALRDKIAEMGTTTEKLHTIGQGSQFGVSELLTADSIVGENKEKQGVGDDQKYSHEQIRLRDLIAKINQEEIDHGIVDAKGNPDESGMAVANKFINDDTKTKEELSHSVSTTLGVTTLRFYNSIDLTKAKVGANHAASGDNSGTYYSGADVSAFNDVVTLQGNKQKDEARIKELKDKYVTPAPVGAVAITEAEATSHGLDKSIAGKHRTAVGDKTGNDYKSTDAINVVTAEEYAKKLKIYQDAKDAYDIFLKLNANEAKFFEFKTSIDPKWSPIAGRNFTNQQFEYRTLLNKRDALKVGRTMVNIDPDSTPSELGTNRGQLQDVSDQDSRLVMYEDKGLAIKDEILGSDNARIGYVLNPSGSYKINADAPVLTSLREVAEYLQNHPELASEELTQKFALLQKMSTKDMKDIDKIVEEEVSMDRYRAMEDNYKWGDE